MKKQSIAILLLFVATFAKSQITDTGDKVGIGESSPSNKLHVKFQNAALGFDQAIKVQTNWGNFSVGRGGGVVMQNADVITGGIFGIRETNSWQGALSFYTHTSANGNTFGSTFTEKMRISAEGLVGIGTKNPDNNLHVSIPNGNLNFDQAIRVQTNLGNFTVGRGGGMIMQNADVITAGIFGIRETNSWTGALTFYTHDSASGNTFGSTFTEKMRITNNGNVGIGTTNTFGYKLAVNGTIGAKEVNVENTSAWPDFVFEKDYSLRPLEEVEKYIKENKHLPEVPSEAEVTENGVDLGKMNAKLLQKIEELTLYLIEQNKELEAQKTANEKQQKMIEELQKKVSSID